MQAKNGLFLSLTVNLHTLQNSLENCQKSSETLLQELRKINEKFYTYLLVVIYIKIYNAF
jgi:hypothetical protein